MRNFDFKIEYEKTIVGDKFVEEKIVPIAGKEVYFTAKRLSDIIFSILGIIILIIPALIIAVLVKITSRGPIFYFQDRLGRYGKPFKIIKFRTMRVGAEERSGPMWAEKDDPRVTNFGLILRKSHFDELPQLINVLKGDMSIVGPRPERECFYKEFAKHIEGFEQRMLVPQGITGLAQVSGGYDLLPQKKIIYDLHYIKKCSLLFDFMIIFRTILGMIHDMACCKKCN